MTAPSPGDGPVIRPTLRSTIALVRTDVAARRRYEAGAPHVPGRLAMLLSPCVLGIVLYRLSHWLYLRNNRTLAWMCWVLQQMLTGIEITPESVIGPGFVITHGVGVTIAARVGANVTFHARAAAGGRVSSDTTDASRYGLPVIEDDVVVGSGAHILGNITIGAGAVIGAGSLVIKSVPAGMAAAGHPAKVIPRDELSWAQPAVRGHA